MPKKMSLKDFRAVRVVLKPSDFALGDKSPDPPPTQLIGKKTWSHITTLPDDVSIRTSNHHGCQLKNLYHLNFDYIKAIPIEQIEKHNPIYEKMLDAYDEFQAALYFSLCGWYRQSFGCLRNIVELVTIGAYYNITGDPSYKDWRKGECELGFGKACDKLIKNPKVPIQVSNSLFAQKKAGSSGGWARCLYSKLCNYAHSRPGYTNPDMVQSNGPVYNGEIFLKTVKMQIKVYLYCYLVVKFADSNFRMPDRTQKLLFDGAVSLEQIAINI